MNVDAGPQLTFLGFEDVGRDRPPEGPATTAGRSGDIRGSDTFNSE